MSSKERVFWRTGAGEQALASDDASVPSDYRRLLRIVEGRTHASVIRGKLRQFPDALIDDWLDELEELGFLASRRGEITQDLDFSALVDRQRTLKAAPAPEDRGFIEGQSNAASAALGRQGVFLSEERIANRAPTGKKPQDITVLIVEDDPDQAALADRRVELAGYRTLRAHHCGEMLEALHDHGPPDLLLLDILLPDVDGFEILDSLRQHELLALVPVILLTSLVDQDNVQRGLTLGADGYMTKPYSKKILAETIRKVLKHA